MSTISQLIKGRLAYVQSENFSEVVARIGGGPEYQDTMRRLAKDSSQLFQEGRGPCSNAASSLPDDGFTYPLTEMLLKLKGATSAYLNSPVHMVLVTVPWPRTYGCSHLDPAQRSVTDAIDLAGLTSIPVQTAVKTAAYGSGFPRLCEYGDSTLDDPLAVVVGYETDAFTTALLHNDDGCAVDLISFSQNQSLGSNACVSDGTPSQECFMPMHDQLQAALDATDELWVPGSTPPLLLTYGDPSALENLPFALEWLWQVKYNAFPPNSVDRRSNYDLANQRVATGSAKIQFELESPLELEPWSACDLVRENGGTCAVGESEQSIGF